MQGKEITMCLKNEVDDEAVSGFKIRKGDKTIRHVCTVRTNINKTVKHTNRQYRHWTEGLQKLKHSSSFITVGDTIFHAPMT